MINLKECESILFIVNFLACVINDNEIFYQSILSTCTCYLSSSRIYVRLQKSQMYRLCYMSGGFSVLKLQCLFFFLFKHAVVLLVNTLQPVKMAHALTCIHVHVLKVIPELIVILLLVCRILVYLLKNVQHTFGIFCFQFFQFFPYL